MSRFSVRELQKFKYPNLIAEIDESGYSICTLGEHMGLGRVPEDSTEVWDRLTGKKEIMASEVIRLACLFGTEPDYLLSQELSVLDGKPFAYLRWKEANEKRERESREFNIQMDIMSALRKKPYLLKFVSMIVLMSREEADAAMAAVFRTEKGGAA